MLSLAARMGCAALGCALALSAAAMPTRTLAEFPDWQPLPPDDAHGLAKRAGRADLAELPAGSLHAMRAGRAKAAHAWQLRLPDGQRLRLQDPQRIEHANGDVSLSGAVAGVGVGYYGLLTVGREASFASLDTPHGRFRLEAQGEYGWLVALDHPQLLTLEADHAALPALESSQHAPQHAAPSPGPHGSKAAKAGTVIDMLFLYSADYAARYPGSAVETRINHLVTLANQLFANSDVDLAVRVVGIDPSAYPDDEGGGNNGFALSRMADALNSASSIHPAFGNLRNRRDALGADLVGLFWPADIETRGSCGIARLFGRGANDGVNVVADGFTSWSLCADDVLAHEIGHNLGAEHQNGANSTNAGFGTAHVVPGQLHTVMGSFGSGHPDRGRRLARFSNPRQLCGGRACGQPSVSDNARRLGDTMAAVAAYQPTRSGAATPPTLAAVDPDSDADGAPDSADAFPFDARFSSDRDGDGVADEEDAFPDDPAESADSDGDGIGDHSDADDDNDGVPDAQDAFPQLASETLDSDGDGFGDNADAFPQDRREWQDLDADGLGDNADPDRDGDGFADFADHTGAQDLLVISADSDRLLRYRTEDGLFAGIELAESHVPQVFGPQAGLAWSAGLKLLYSTNSSALRRYRRHDGQRHDVFIAGYRGGAQPGFLSGFPVALSLGPDDSVYAVDNSGTPQRHDAIDGNANPGGEFGRNLLSSPPRASVVSADGLLWLLERNGTLSAINTSEGALQRQLVPSMAGGLPALVEPTAMLMDADDRRLLIADAAEHRVMRIDPDRAGDAQILIAAGAGGLQTPAGLARLADGSLLVASSGSDALLRFDPAGQPLGRFDSGPPGLLLAPRSLLVLPRVVDRFPDHPRRALLPVAGGWANPDRLGHGLDVQNAGDQLSVIWYTFREDGRPIWYLALGTLEGARWNAELLQFRWQDDSASATPVGTASLEFSSERHAVFHWTLADSSGSEPMQPLDVGPSSRTQFPTAAWFDPSQPGWGLSVARQGGVDYAIAFLYDPDGHPTWLAGAADVQGEPQRYRMFRYDGPTRCPGCPGDAEASLSAAGELSFVADSLDTGRFASALSADVVSWQRDTLSLQRLTDTPTREDGSPLPPR
jgi:hypothetical protein